MSLTYFTNDGSYGNAKNLVVVDTSKWTDEDWTETEQALSWEQSQVAMRIAARYE